MKQNGLNINRERLFRIRMLFSKPAFREAVINAFAHNDWTHENSPMFTTYQDRIEIISMGPLPTGQTKDGFYRGISKPVNKKLAEILIQLHISEKSGRGVPRIVAEYGKDVFEFAENYIAVTLPFHRLDLGSTAQEATQVSTQETTQEATQEATQATTQETNAPETNKGKPVDQKILDFCRKPRSTTEIAEMLGFRERKSAARYIRQLVLQGRIAMTIPDIPSSRNQMYIAIDETKAPDFTNTIPDKQQVSGKNVGKDGGKNGGKDNNIEEKIIAILRDDPKATIPDIAQRMSMAIRTIERVLRKLRENGRIVRVDGRKLGFWEILDSDEPQG